jgi:hypothetical protein
MRSGVYSNFAPRVIPGQLSRRWVVSSAVPFPSPLAGSILRLSHRSTAFQKLRVRLLSLWNVELTELVAGVTRGLAQTSRVPNRQMRFYSNCKVKQSAYQRVVNNKL